MTTDRAEYEATPEDIDRVEHVHAVISSCPAEFADAAQFIDRNYSEEQMQERAQAQQQLLDAAKKRERELSRVPDVTGIERIVLSTFIPPTCSGVSRGSWDEPLVRWEVLLFNLIHGELPIGPPGPSWELAAKVMLVYWITCDERAETGPSLTAFQSWPWKGGTVIRRAAARGFVEDWPKFNRAVDVCCAVAKHRGLAVAFSPRNAKTEGPTDRSPPQEQHADDFTWMVVREKRYEFPRRQQALVIGALYKAWEDSGRRDGSGLHTETLSTRVQFNGMRFRVEKVFTGHPALGTILRRVAKGTWALHLGLALGIPAESP